MTNRVNIDDPITYVEGPLTILDHVEAVQREMFTSGGHRIFRHDAEGANWLRGHYLPSSDAVKALKAATAMVEIAPMPQFPPTGLPAAPSAPPPFVAPSHPWTAGQACPGPKKI